MAEPDVHVPLSEAARVQFRLRARFLFLTWPQCDTPKETVLANIKKLTNYEYAVVCREDHKDEAGVHLHAFVALTKRCSKTGCKWLDDLAGKHGHYRAARNNYAIVNYVIKDGDYVFDGFDPAVFLGKRMQKKKSTGPSKSSEVARLVVEENADLDAIDAVMPEFVLMNKRKLQEYISYQQVKRAKANLKPWTSLDMSSYANDHQSTFKIAKWIAANIKVPREFKQKQLYVWSDGPNAGKTELVIQLSKMLSVFHVPKTGYVDGYQSNYFDLLVIDEFKSHFTIQFLNEFLQGSTMHLNQKGTGTVKTDNPPIIILSNYSLEECYSKKQFTGAFEALKSRLKIVKVPKGVKIDVFHTLPK